MKAVFAAIATSCVLFASAAADPVFSTGGPCASDPISRSPNGARQVLLSNPAKVHLAATLYRQIDKPNFKYLDADGAERLSDFPYHYQVFIPPHGTGPVGCTKLFVPGGEAVQTFFLQKTDYFLDAPQDNNEEARLSAGFIPAAGNGFNLINLHATKAIHVTLDRSSGPLKLDLLPQAVSAAMIDGSSGDAKSGRPIVKDVRF